MKYSNSCKKVASLVVAIFFPMLVLLSTCGTDDSTSVNANAANLTLRVTDAPIDGANEVIVTFSEVELKPNKIDIFTLVRTFYLCFK